ncbi:16S rRNA (cytosine(1402)-N(4))-methyltransferase RsmH [bacterium]|nr:16S rRNA (cytosine(1402)-N(4))-methyltransferase RsmH [bacterium]
MHQSVFLSEAIDYLDVRPGSWYLDATLGGGGHSREILRRGGKVVALDYDREVCEKQKQAFASEIQEGRVRIIQENFAHLQQVQKLHLTDLGEQPFSGAFFDLGTNSDQLTSGKNGLSVYENGPLDMRLDQTLNVTARDLLMALSEKQLSELFIHYGGEVEARRIAREIVLHRQRRGQDAFKDSFELANLVSRIKKAPPHRLHPATKVFQALRIAVNDEIGNLERGLPQAFNQLQSGGRMVVIAFHEGEDRPVKHFFRHLQEQGLATILTKRPLVPDSQAIQDNPRARSARLRALVKV